MFAKHNPSVPDSARQEPTVPVGTVVTVFRLEGRDFYFALTACDYLVALGFTRPEAREYLTCLRTAAGLLTASGSQRP